MVRKILTTLIVFFTMSGSLYAQSRVEHVFYQSSISETEDKRALNVYLPEGYDSTKETKYPVLYLLHGKGGDEYSWLIMGHITQIMDSLITENKVRPMIVVMPNGNVEQGAASTRSMMGRIESHFVPEVMAYVETHYRTLNEKSHRAIAGMNLGGLHSLFISANNPDKFDYVGLFTPQTTNALSNGTINAVQGIYDAAENLPFFGGKLSSKLERKYGAKENFDVYRNIDAKLKEQFEIPPRLYYIACDKEDYIKNLVDMHRKRLDNAGYKYTYVETKGEHSWGVWRRYLIDFLSRTNGLSK